MEEYLNKLEKDLSDKKLDNFWVLLNDEFKAIKKSKTEIKMVRLLKIWVVLLNS
jgi:hypothetical protein